MRLGYIHSLEDGLVVVRQQIMPSVLREGWAVIREICGQPVLSIDTLTVKPLIQVILLVDVAL